MEATARVKSTNVHTGHVVAGRVVASAPHLVTE